MPKMIFSLFLLLQFDNILAKVYETPVLQESDRTYEHVWHSYIFNTGAGNREELHFSSAGLDSSFKSSKNVYTWKSIQIENEVAVVGLGDNFLHVTIYNEEIDSVTKVEDLEGSPVGLTLFRKWNGEAQEMKNYAVVPVEVGENNYIIKWYEIFNGSLKLIWDWPFYRKITHLEVIKIGHESKLLIVNYNNKTYNPSADVYNFNIGKIVDVWLFEKIILDDIPSSVVIIDNNENVFLCASFPSLEMVHIFKYSKSICVENSEQKYFVSHQRIYKIGLNSLISFRVGFRWYLAVASKSSSIYRITENFLFQSIDGLNLGNLNSWLAVPVNSYREDVVLLADSYSDLSVIAWTGDENLEVVGSFIKMACGNDTTCLEKTKYVSLNHSTSFNVNNHQNILISGENGIPLMFKLLIVLKPLPDQVTLKLNEILKMKNALEMDFNNQNKRINQLQKDAERGVKSVVTTATINESNENPPAESQTKSWTEIMSSVNSLRTKISALNSDLSKFERDLKSNISYQNEPKSMAVLPRSVPDGITFYGNVLINDLHLSTLNGHDVGEILGNSFRKDKISKIHGEKTLRKLNAENVMFEKLGEILTCDIVFSGDLCEEQNKSVINGDIVVENLNVLNDVILTEPTIRKSFQPSQESSIIEYDTLNFDELEVTEEMYVQETINGKLFILPVHGIQFNILDAVNQARIEVVNVKENLNVGFINGKNLSGTFHEIIFKSSPSPRNVTVKVNGTFQTSSLEVNELNALNMVRDRPNRLSEKMPEDTAEYSSGDNFKRAKETNLKRVVHVFQNLEIDGILMSNRINNISWKVLNDIVKKGEENVTLNGVKKFQGIVKTPEIISTGTVNGRFIENVMTNFSDQVIWFPQIFDNVKFKNLSVEGSWDDVDVNHLSTSFYRLSNVNCNCNVTFKNECVISELNVTESVNGLNVTNNGMNDIFEVKTIKTPNVILHGSLITNNKINQMNLTHFNLLRVSLTSPETIERDLSHYNITIGGDLNLKTLNFNDVTNVINSEGDTNLIEKFLAGDIHRLRRLLVKGLVRTSHGINGFNLTRVFENGICIAEPNSMKGNITFENTVNFNDINVTGTIDGFSLKRLEKDIILKHSQVFLNAGKNFTTLKVTKNMRARTLNGHLMQDIVTLQGDHNMKGPVHINGDVIVKGDITTYSAINNITVPDLLRSFSTNFNSYIHSGDLNLESDKVTIRNLILGGDVQNISLNGVIDDAIRKDESFAATGSKFFNGKVSFKENIFIEKSIHGLDFSDFYADVVFINEPSKIQGSVKIEEAVLKTLQVNGHFNSTLINKVDTSDWSEESIALDKYEIVNGKKTFENAVVMRDVSINFINDHLPSAMILLKGKQHIPALVLFPKIHMVNDLEVSGSVNGLNLNEELQNTVLSHGVQTISGRVLFSNEFVVNGNLYVDTIKGKKVNDLITLDTDQKIRSPLHFKGSVVAKQNVENLKVINGISVSEWKENSVALNQEQVLRGSWIVKGSVKAKNINGDGLLYGISLRNISKDVQDGRLVALETKNETEAEYDAQCRKIETLSRELLQLPSLFHQFEITQEIESSPAIESVITLKINGEDYLIVNLNNICFSSLYKWDKEKTSYVPMGQLNIGPVTKWLVIYLNRATYVVTISLKSSIACEENLHQSNVWIFDGDYEKYGHLPLRNGLLDITQENDTSVEFFSLDDGGDLHVWTLGEGLNVTSKFLAKVGQGNYKFIEFRITESLAVSNGREIRQYKINGSEVTQSSALFFNGQMVALPIDGKILTANILKDKVVIYENLFQDKIFSVIQVYRAGSAVWFNYGREKQAFLIIASHHKLIEIHEYKGVSGFVKIMSFPMFSFKLQSVILASAKRHHFDKYLIVIQKKKLIFLRAEMLGDYWQEEDSLY